MPERRISRVAASVSLAIVLVYLALAYIVTPDFWSWHLAGRSPASMRTTTTQGIPGGPINVGLVGSRSNVFDAFAAAGWSPADAITMKSSLEIALSVVLDRPDADAPVSTLLFDGRHQDFAFEKLDGESADRRHHVRFWLSGAAPGGFRPLWLGAVSFDRGVGLSHDTGQITHHIGPDLDAERDRLMRELNESGRIESSYSIEGIGPTRDGRNGEGDPFFTDGKATIGVLRPLQ